VIALTAAAVLLAALAAVFGFMAWRAGAAGASAGVDRIAQWFEGRAGALESSLTAQFAKSGADMAARVEQTRGDLNLQINERLQSGFAAIQSSVEKQMGHGRDEQSKRLGEFAQRQENALAQSRTELASAMKQVSEMLRSEVQALSVNTALSLDKIRTEVDQKLAAITEQVQHKLDQNISEGIRQFEKVQLHFKLAEEQLRHVSEVGESINDLNSLLKLPHLRGSFGEQSLERLLKDFLPPHMFEMQASPTGNGAKRADAVIIFPNARLPIDAKFPREQIRALFEESDEASLALARANFARVLKEQARRIENYVQPADGTTDIALMYLPSETLYFEAVQNPELSEFLNQRRVFPVSPNTLIVTLKAIAMIHGWFEVARSFKQTRDEIAKARKHFEYFEAKFQVVGESLDRARDAFGKAETHLGNYRSKIGGITGEEASQLELPEPSAVK
jgi:DNA recombination protein RmuC